MSTALVRIPNARFGYEYMQFTFAELDRDEDVNDIVNSVHVTHYHFAGEVLHVSSEGNLNRTTARKWWRDAMRDGGEVIAA